MTFLNQRLPTNVELGAIRHDDEDIEIVTTDGGWEVRNARQSQSLLRFDISFPASRRDDADYLAVIAMFKAARKSLHTFRFRDWSNYQLDEEVIGTGDGTTTAFQVKQSWTVDGVTHGRNITRPVSPLSVYKDGVLQGSGYSINYTTGVLTFTAAPALGVEISVSGEFDIPVRFETPMQSTGLNKYLEHIDTLTLKEDRE